ncbi:MAG: helix-turn-helix transcriptional regulator [Bacillota bacterium]|nr:helix-turn-helix transcriptional regulator [Bacillota bacterium]
MTYQQKETIKQMRSTGHSYSKIAMLLGISENTVKSFCRRNNLGGVGLAIANQAPGVLCRQCGTLLTHTAGAKQKRFCSDRCRMTWWNAHPEAVNRKALYPFICAHCGAACESYGNKKRKYCSRACYVKSKAVRHE